MHKKYLKPNWSLIAEDFNAKYGTEKKGGFFTQLYHGRCKSREKLQQLLELIGENYAKNT